MMALKYGDESFRIRGAVFEVYKEMGCGFLEAVYQECLARELQRSQIPFRAQVFNYLKATGHKLGLLVNFGHYPKAEKERVRSCLAHCKGGERNRRPFAEVGAIKARAWLISRRRFFC